MITVIIFNAITCPFTVLLNVMVILAVKRRPRLQSNTNILLACLAVTDALVGLAVQTSFIQWKTLQISGGEGSYAETIHRSCLRAVSVCSCLHLMLVTWQRLMAIKFTMRYPYIVTKRNITIAVISFWIFCITGEVFRLTKSAARFLSLLVALVLFSCVVFVLFSYAALYRETLRHHKMIKTQQLPQHEMQTKVS